MMRLSAPDWFVPLERSDSGVAGDGDRVVGAPQVGLPARGAQLLELAGLGVPVQPGFVLTRALGEKLTRDGRLPRGFDKILEVAIAELAAETGTRLGDARSPLLLAVVGEGTDEDERPGPLWPLGIDDAARRGLVHRTGSARFAWDAARRGIVALGTRAFAIPPAAFCTSTADDLEPDLESAERAYHRAAAVFELRAGRPFPVDPMEQVTLAIKTELGRRPDGAAVVVQAVLLGNTGADSGRGLVVTRDPMSGRKGISVDFRVNMGPFEPATFDDAGAGSERLESDLPAAWRQLQDLGAKLERRFADMQEFEFVLDGERLAVLAVRPGRRAASAALTVALDLVKDGIASRRAAVELLRDVDVDRLVIERVTGADVVAPLARGTAVALGAASGRLALSSRHALQLHRRGDAVILVHEDRAGDDLQGLAVARGVLCLGGGRSGPAAAMARRLGVPALLDCDDLVVDHAAACLNVAGQVVREGDVVTVEGNLGCLFAGELPITRDAAPEELATVRRWLWEAGVKEHPLA